MSIILNKPRAPALKWGKFIMFNIDFRCNRVIPCPFCYNQMMDETTEKTTEEIINEVSKQAEENKTKFLLISGGEPLASTMLIPTLDAMDGKSTETIIATNGDLITPGMLQEIASRGCDHIALSVSNQDGIKKALVQLDMLEAEGFTVGISAVHTRLNHYYFIQMVELLAKHSGVRAITKQNICPHPLMADIIPQNNDSNEVAYGMLELQEKYENVTFRLARRPLDSVVLKKYLPDLPEPDCGDNWTGGHTRILPNGDITNCVTHGQHLGNIMTHNLKEMGSNLDELRNHITPVCPYYQYLVAQPKYIKDNGGK